MNWVTLYALLKNKIGATKAELEQEILEKIGLTNQFLDELPETGESGALYFIPKEDPQDPDQYYMYVWDPDKSEFVLLDPDMDLSIYAKTADLAAVATSGSYTDLNNKPELKDLTDDANHRTVSDDEKAVWNNPPSCNYDELRNKPSVIRMQNDILLNDDPVYMKRKIPAANAVNETMSLVGATVNANQLVYNGNFADTSNWETNHTTLTANNNIATVVGDGGANTSIYQTNFNIKENHLYIYKMKIKSDIATTATRARLYKLNVVNKNFKYASLSANTTYEYIDVWKPSENYSNLTLYIYFDTNYSGTGTIEDVELIDVTRWFGSTEIPDKAYTLEQTESGSGIAWLKSQGFFNELYIGYRANGLASVRVEEKVNVGFNQWDEVWEVGDIDRTTGGNQPSTTQIRTKNYLSAYGGSRYYVYIDAPTTNSIAIVQYDADKSFIQSNWRSNGATFTMEANAKYFRFVSNNNYGNTYGKKICINISNASRNGTYEPYHAETIAFDTSKTLRGRYILDGDDIKADGDIYKADGSCPTKYGFVTVNSGITQMDSQNKLFRLPDASGIKSWSSLSSVSTYIMANDLDNYSLHGMRADTSIMGIAQYMKILYICLGTNITTIADANAYLAQHPLQIQYELDTPTTESATPFTPIQSIDGNGTEEFVDYGVTSGNRDFVVPVGVNAKYYGDGKTGKDIKMPALLTEGTKYIPVFTVSGNTLTGDWEEMPEDGTNEEY